MIMIGASYHLSLDGIARGWRKDGWMGTEDGILLYITRQCS
eukprot:COSAG06_NODE_4522_length_4185_cov_4.546990_5_plen_40_part_01